MIRKILIAIRQRLEFLTGDPEYSYWEILPEDGTSRYNHEKEVFEKYDAFFDRWVKIRDRTFPVP